LSQSRFINIWNDAHEVSAYANAGTSFLALQPQFAKKNHQFATQGKIDSARAPLERAAGSVARMFSAVAQRCSLLNGPEKSGQVMRVSESEFGGDFGDRKIGFDEQLGDVVGADPMDFLKDRTAEKGSETLLEGAPGEAGGLGDLVYGGAASGFVTDEAQSAGESRLFGGHEIGGTAGDDIRSDRHNAAGNVAIAAHELVKSLRGFVAGAFEIDSHARKGRIRQATDDFIIVGANNADLVRYYEAGEFAGVHDLLAAIVIAGH
jgi:hypothetical protein